MSVRIDWPQTRRELRRGRPLRRAKVTPPREWTPEQLAEAVGYVDGKRDLQTASQNYAAHQAELAGREYCAWLKGWRRGQREYLATLPPNHIRRVHIGLRLALLKGGA